MKKIILVCLILGLMSTALFAQLRGTPELPTTEEVRQQARQFRDEVSRIQTEFEEDLDYIRERNLGNNDAADFVRLRNEIIRLEGMINTEYDNILARLNRGIRVSFDIIDRFERMVEQHRGMLETLDGFIETH